MRKKDYILIVLLIFFLGFFRNHGLSQNSLTAEDAVMIALENNFQMQIAKKQIEMANKNNSWSEAGLFPTVDLNASYGTSIIDNTNNPFTFTPGVLASRQFNPSLNANWNIFSGFAVKISKQRLEQLEMQSKGNAMLIIENISSEVLKSYYTVINQQMRLQVLEEIYKLSKTQFEYENLKSDFGQSNSLNILQLKNKLFTDSINVIQQKINIENTLRNLMILMNMDEQQILSSEFPTLNDSLNIILPEMNQNEIINLMKSSNQNLKNQMINLELQKTTSQIQKSFLYPTISLQLGVSPSFGNFSSISDNNGISAETKQINYFGNVSLRYNLFNNWKNKRAVEISQIQEEITAMNALEMEKQLTSNVIALYKSWEINQSLVDLSAQNIQYAKDALALGENRYALGTINSIELTLLQNNYLNSALGYYDNLFQRIDLFIEIMKVSGKMQLAYND